MTFGRGIRFGAEIQRHAENYEQKFEQNEAFYKRIIEFSARDSSILPKIIYMPKIVEIFLNNNVPNLRNLAEPQSTLQYLSNFFFLLKTVIYMYFIIYVIWDILVDIFCMLYTCLHKLIKNIQIKAYTYIKF